MLRLLAALTLLLSASDHWTTYLCLRAPVEGLSEANPMAAWLFEQIGLVEGLALDSVITVLGLIFLLHTALLPRWVKLGFLLVVVAGTGEDQVHGHATLAGLLQGGEHPSPGCEVGAREPHLALRPGQSVHHQVASATARVQGAIGDHGTAHVAVALGRVVEELVPGERRGRVGAEPALQEHRLQVAHRRPLDADVGVAPAGILLAPVFVAYVEPPGEGHGAVEGEDLAVVPASRRPDGIDPAQGVEGRHLAAGGPQGPEGRLVEVDGADGVVEHPHLGAPPGRRGQGVEEAAPGPSGAEDVGLQVDAAARPLDARQHRPEAGLAPGVELHPVAGREAESVLLDQLPHRRRTGREPVASQTGAEPAGPLAACALLPGRPRLDPGGAR